MLQVFYCDPRGRNLSLKNMIGKTLPEIIRVPYVFKYVNHLEEVAKEVKPYSILFYYLEGGGVNPNQRMLYGANSTRYKKKCSCWLSQI